MRKKLGAKRPTVHIEINGEMSDTTEIEQGKVANQLN